MSYVENSLAKSSDVGSVLAPPRQPLSIRLSAIFFLASLLLVAICSGILYWAVVEALRQADVQVIEKRLAAITGILDAKDMNEGLVAHEVDEDNQGPRQIFIRVVTDFVPLQLETQTMNKVLPAALFPDVRNTTLKENLIRTLVTANGETYQALAVRVPVVGKPGPAEAIVQVATDTTLDKDSLALFRRVLFMVLGAAVPLCGAVAWWLVHRELKPLSRISKATESIDGETLNTRLSLTGLPAELHTLASHFNQMLARLEGTCNGLKQYADNIAHELRTPVNRMRLEAEIALRHPLTPEEYKECISSNAIECETLTRMLQGLLFLARAENGQTVISAKPFAIQPMLDTVKDYFESGAAASGIILTIEDANKLELSADRDLVQRGLANLISNALTHTQKGGSVHVKVLPKPNAMTFIVEDTGAGIAPEHHARLFDRFYRGGHASMGPSDRLGLGLAITKSIVDLHGGTIDLESGVGKGTKFTVSFPGRALAGERTFASVKPETAARPTARAAE